MPKKDRLTRLIDNLILKSEAATPGLWVVQNYTQMDLGIYVFSHHGEGYVIATASSIGLGLTQAVANAAYIAACTPETIREICTALGRARSDIAVHESTIAELEAKIVEQQRELNRQEKELAACYETINTLMDPKDDSDKVMHLEAEAGILSTWLANAYLGRDLLPDIDNGMSPPDPAQLREAAREQVAGQKDPALMRLRGVRLAVGKQADRPEQDHA